MERGDGMKTFLRYTSGVLLCCMLAVFCLLRYDAIPDLSAVTSFLKSTADYVGHAVSFVEQTTSPSGGGESGGGAGKPQRPVDTAGSYGGYDLSESVPPDIEAAILEGYRTLAPEIELSSFGMTKDEVNSAVAAIRFSSPEFFYVGNSYVINYTSGDLVRSVAPTYTHDLDEIAQMQVEYEAALDAIVAGVPDGSEFDKILYLHDYFVQNYTYDHTLTIRDAYTFFTQKTGVCQAYMLALIAAAERVGIESLPVTSEVMAHAWNLVRIDGAWYHIDVTWDDSMTLPSHVSYTYFLRSDRGMINADAAREESARHRDWSAEQAAADERYEDVIFRTSNTPIVKWNDTYFCVGTTENRHARGAVYSGTDVTELMHCFDITGGYWLAGTDSYYTDCFSGLAILDNILYCSSGNSIHYVELDEPSATPKVYLVTGLGRGECIYGFVGGGTSVLDYVIATSPTAADYRLGSYTLP